MPAETAIPEAYPSPAEQSVVTEAPQAAPGQALYPEPQSGDTVNWSQAVAMLNNGEISQILKTDNLELTLESERWPFTHNDRTEGRHASSCDRPVRRSLCQS